MVVDDGRQGKAVEKNRINSATTRFLNEDTKHRSSIPTSTENTENTTHIKHPHNEAILPPLGKQPHVGHAHATTEKTKTKCQSEMKTKISHKHKHVSSNQTLRHNVIPEIKIVDWDTVMEAKRKRTPLDDAPSNLARHHRTPEDKSLQKHRESLHKSRDHLMTLMPSQNAKRNQFSSAAVSGAQQELKRMRKLTGRDQVAREKGHVDAIVGESRKRAAKLNAMMSGQAHIHNTTTNNNIRVHAHVRTSGSDVKCKTPTGAIRHSQCGLQHRKRRLPMLSVILANHEKKIPNVVLAFLNAFRQPAADDLSSRLGHIKDATPTCSNKSLVFSTRHESSAKFETSLTDSQTSGGYHSPHG